MSAFNATFAIPSNVAEEDPVEIDTKGAKLALDFAHCHQECFI